MGKKIRNIVILVLSVILIYVGFRIVNDQDKLIEDVDNLSYKLFNRYVFKDTNELNNYDEIIKIASNKDYSNSSFYPYYDLLDNDEKIVYNQLKDTANDYQKSFVPSIDIDSNKFKDVFISFFNDHPEVFWLSIDYNATIEEIDSKEKVVSVELTYTDVMDTIGDARKLFNERVAEIVEEAKGKKLDYDKIYFVHNKLIDMLEFDNNQYVDQSAFGAINQKRAVCVGYTKLFQVIIMKLGIPTYYITGKTGDEYHTWNLVELDDGFYNIDLTWDDNKKVIYKYFMINDNSINKDHTRDELSSKIKVKNGIKYLNKYSLLN